MHLTVPPAHEAPTHALRWGWKVVRPDFSSRNGFVWPDSPGWAETTAAPDRGNLGSCPRFDGDGLCAGLTWRGVASGCHRSGNALLVCWSPEDEWARDLHKVRVARAWVSAVFDRRLGLGPYADLQGADLRYADLRGADLRYADLRSAHLQGAKRSKGLAGWVPVNGLLVVGV